MNRALTQQRLDAAIAQLALYDAAEAALLSGGIESYILDTGQTRTNVTKLNLNWIRQNITFLENKCAVYQTRLDGSGVVTVNPAW